MCEKTLKRIYAGLQKFVPISQKEWILKYMSNSPTTGVNRGATVNEPLHTITTQSRLGLCSVEYLPAKINSNFGFIDKYYGIANAQSIEKVHE